MSQAEASPARVRHKRPEARPSAGCREMEVSHGACPKVPGVAGAVRTTVDGWSAFCFLALRPPASG